MESRGAWLTAASGHSPHASPPGLHHPEAVTPSHGASQRATRQGGRGCAVIGKIQSFLKIAIPLLPAQTPPLLWGPSQSPTLDVTTACGNAVPGGRRICMCRLPSWVGLGRALPGRTGLTLRVLQDLTASQTTRMTSGHREQSLRRPVGAHRPLGNGEGPSAFQVRAGWGRPAPPAQSHSAWAQDS